MSTLTDSRLPHKGSSTRMTVEKLAAAVLSLFAFITIFIGVQGEPRKLRNMGVALLSIILLFVGVWVWDRATKLASKMLAVVLPYQLWCYSS